MPICLPDSIRTGLPYLLASSHHRQLDLFSRHTARFNIAAREYAALLLLEARSDLWQSQIAETLGMDRTTVTYLVDELEQRGWLVRRRDPSDRRAHVISLTPAGQQALTGIKPAVREAKQELLAPLSDSEQDQLCNLLVRLTAPAP